MGKGIKEVYLIIEPVSIEEGFGLKHEFRDKIYKTTEFKFPLST